VDKRERVEVEQMSDIVWKNITVKLGDLKPWADNPRMSTKAQAKRLLQSFDKFGQVQTVAIDPDGNVLDGHQRLSALLTIHGNKYELDARQSNRPLTDAERRELVVSLHAGAVGSWDWDRVSGWDAAELQGWGMDKDLLKSWNNDANNLKELLKSEAPTADAEPQVDRAAELLEKWGVQPGDLWQIGDHRLICGDCTDAATVARVMGGERADMVFTDPPYGIEYDNAERWQGIEKQNEGATRTRGEMIQGDDQEFDPSFILSEFSYCKEVFLWGMQYYLEKLPNGGVIVWNRKTKEQENTPHADFELCWSKVQRHKMAWITWGGWKSKEAGEERLHTTQKPVELAVWFLDKWSKDDDIVWDGYLGSGTTLVACENLRRKCRAIEISPAYVAVALERMSAAFPALDIRRVDTVMEQR
jgi:DNA modification methylase